MTDSAEADAKPIQFAWGAKKGRGAKEMSVQFYSSFTYDNVEYSLYDCVYLHKEGEPEPFIGKIVKMWEQQGNKKRVKILWFFRPIDIRNYLREADNPLINELFLACGRGVGVSDVNILECIGGKCNVICTSKDPRNPQPSEEYLKLADYIFYRFFDVGLFKLSDEIAETVDGVEAKHIFNSNKEVDHKRFGMNGEREKSSHVVDIVTEKSHSFELETSAAVENSGPLDSPEDSSMKIMRHPDASRKPKSSKGTDAAGQKMISKLDNGKLMRSKGTKEAEENIPAKPEGEFSFLERGKLSLSEGTKKGGEKILAKPGDEFSPLESGKSNHRKGADPAEEKMTSKLEGKFSHLQNGKSKFSEETDAAEENMTTKSVGEFSCLESGKLRHSKVADAVDEKMISKLEGEFSHGESGKSRCIEETDAAEEKMTIMLEDKFSRPESGKSRPFVSSPDVSTQKRQNFRKFQEAPRRPGAETSKWFTGISWDKRVPEARKQGNLLLVENFDLMHTSEDIEDLIYHFFRKQCSAKVIESSMFSSPYYGRALVICRNKADAEDIITRLKENVLMLANGRPLVARVLPDQRPPLAESKSGKFHGHYVAEQRKNPKSQREEIRNAVATSHCAQSNTLEFEMAVDWMMLHEKSACWWRELHEEHEREAKKLRIDRPAAGKRAP